MEKIALYELGTSNIRLTIAAVKEGEYFCPLKQYVEFIGIADAIGGDELVKSAKIRECVSILQILKKIADAAGAVKTIAYASENLSRIKNYQTLVEEAGNAIGDVSFTMLTRESEVSAIYTATTNTLDAQRGVILNISSCSTRIVHYNRRIVLDSVTIPVGTGNIMTGVDFADLLSKDAQFLSGVDSETILVGIGESVSAFGRLARKILKYPVEIEHNFTTNSDSFKKVHEFLSTLEPEKRAKLKGISDISVSEIVAGLNIVKSILDFSKLKSIVVATSSRSTGLLLQYAMPTTLERPVPDLLGYSLSTLIECIGLERKNCEQTYALALVLFKQLKVLHKMPRGYAKVLRAASYVHELGKKLNPTSAQSYNYNLVMGLPLLGLTHKEIILTSFVASVKRWEDFNLAEWVRYKEIMTEDDLDAVRRMSNILSIASALNVRNQHIVKDISCDILGDSVILKLITELDQKQAQNVDPLAASLEIFYAKKYAGEFSRAFKKSLEIL